ncbi:MAG: PIN domain-containing protein [Candidatus Nanohaloarchaea archaeon]
MKDILLDTNFLTAPFQLNVSIFEGFEEKYPGCSFYTLDEVVEEAKSIEGGKYGDLVQQLVEKEGVEVLETEGNGFVDDLLVDLSDRFLVATNDKELRQRILERGRPVAYIRSGSHVVIENEDF